MVKPLSRGQTFSAMVGYITKGCLLHEFISLRSLHAIFDFFLFYIDQGQPHYSIVSHGLSAQDLTNGRRDHENLRATISQEKKVVTSKNLFNECWRFHLQCLQPVIAPIEYVMTYMIQSGNYSLAPDFISSATKINLSEATTMWSLIQDPQSCTVTHIRELIFDSRSYGRKVFLTFKYIHGCPHYFERLCTCQYIRLAPGTIGRVPMSDYSLLDVKEVVRLE
jgi:hypothetical protein